MPLSTRVKIQVIKEGKLLKTILRCIRPRLDKWVVYYENKTYVVKYANMDRIRYIVLE